MDRSQAKAMLPIITAFAEGKSIQFRTAQEWVDISDSSFSFGPERYRIKPEPQALYIVCRNDGSCAWSPLETPEAAERIAKCLNTDGGYPGYHPYTGQTFIEQQE